MSLLIFIFVGPYYLASFNQMRQYLAIAVFLGYLLPLIEKRRFIQFLFGAVLTAFFSHITVLLTIPLYFVLKKRWDFMTKLLIVVGFMLGIKFLTILILASPYGYFILARSEIELETTMFILQIFIAVIILLFEKKVEKKKKNVEMFFNMALLSILMLFPIVLEANVPAEIFARMNNYFFPFMIIIVPEISKLFNNKSRVLIDLGILVFLSLYFLRNTILSGDLYQLVPYEFNFSIFT